MDVYMLSEGGPCNYDRGARILDLESENEYLRKKLNKKNNNNDDWFKFIVLIFMVAISIKVFL
jgi:hypothetical protein